MWVGPALVGVLLILMIGSGYGYANWYDSDTVEIYCYDGRLIFNTLRAPNVFAHPGDPIPGAPAERVRSDDDHSGWYCKKFSGLWFRRSIPLWIPVVVVVMLTAFAWWPDVRSAGRTRHGRCARCGYARSGLAPGAVCPECGTAPAAAGAAAKA